MGWRRWFALEPAEDRTGTVNFVAREVEQRDVQPFEFVGEWDCGGCENKLRIRSRVDRDKGPSNLGQSVHLNWNGLAIERGWSVDPIRCPLCKLGL